MSKKNKVFHKEFLNERPESVNLDEIGYVQDETLQTIINRFEFERNRVFNSGKDSVPWEIEICYLQREQQLRKVRNEKHEEYMKNFTVENSNLQED